MGRAMKKKFAFLKPKQQALDDESYTEELRAQDDLLEELTQQQHASFDYQWAGLMEDLG